MFPAYYLISYFSFIVYQLLSRKSAVPTTNPLTDATLFLMALYASPDNVSVQVTDFPGPILVVAGPVPAYDLFADKT